MEERYRGTERARWRATRLRSVSLSHTYTYAHMHVCRAQDASPSVPSQGPLQQGQEALRAPRRTEPVLAVRSNEAPQLEAEWSGDGPGSSHTYMMSRSW